MPPLISLGPNQPLAFARSRVDRAADRRGDSGRVAALESEDGAGAYALCADAVLARPESEGRLQPLFTPADARAFGVVEAVFLGLDGGRPRFGFAIDPRHLDALKQREGLVLADLRAIATQGLVAEEHVAPLAEAKSLLSWHARHRFCSNCGAPSQAVEAGWRRDCPACQTQHFPRTDPVAIMLTVDGDHCLLGRSARFLSTMWSCLAGFIEPGETIEDAVRRETFEEAGVHCGAVRYFACQPWPFPSSLMIGCHAQALTREIVVDKTELEEARWFSREEAAAMLALRHNDGLGVPRPVAIAYHIIRHWVEGGVSFD